MCGRALRPSALASAPAKRASATISATSRGTEIASGRLTSHLVGSRRWYVSADRAEQVADDRLHRWLAGRRARGWVAGGHQINRGLLNAVQVEELVDLAVDESADRDGAQLEGRRREQQVLADVTGLEHGEAVGTLSVLELGAAEEGGEHEGDCR